MSFEDAEIVTVYLGDPVSQNILLSRNFNMTDHNQNASSDQTSLSDYRCTHPIDVYGSRLFVKPIPEVCVCYARVEKGRGAETGKNTVPCMSCKLPDSSSSLLQS